ncbi:hypothetical protein EYF80_054100 [Liparis tanakae]|uniref:Uncharacterized protein n=1 Tax=Liparis tanakae TaxID=230148 RepID=A0A4Z2F3V6_9TELE|nr:hypothetical protein EYF80_054100 [Liparis tanakae]
MAVFGRETEEERRLPERGGGGISALPPTERQEDGRCLWPFASHREQLQVALHHLNPPSKESTLTDGDDSSMMMFHEHR